MDVGGATQWSMDRVMTRDEILGALTAHYGPIAALPNDSSAPADRYRLPDGLVFGIIASTTAPFCADCDRSRLTADGMWYLCLYARAGRDLRRVLRSTTDDAELTRVIQEVWQARNDRGAEERLAARDRAPLIPLDTLRRDPHLEMHTRGG
jgi:cyclic pyranopterin phosphate synthase